MEETEMKKAVCLLLVMLLIMATCACAAKGPASVTPNSEESQSTSKEDTGSTGNCGNNTVADNMIHHR